jgi:2-polyprenyl-3-methyl-5-hydroxy-6-metoxy-1,4-benzoquinol methylase
MSSTLREHGNIKSSLKYVENHCTDKKVRILDIGCNLGSLINLLYENGYSEVYGLDIRSEAIKEGQRLYPKLKKRLKDYDGNKIPFPDEYFDVVLMFDVIEHIPKLEKFLKEEVYRILKKDGIFIFQTPNKYLNIIWEIINNRSFVRWKHYHPSLQTRKTLKRVLEDSGFSQVLVEKGEIYTEYNKNKVRKKVSFVGIPILFLLSKMPIFLTPNLWGRAKKVKLNH